MPKPKIKDRNIDFEKAHFQQDLQDQEEICFVLPKIDELVKSPKTPFSVIPAEAGIQEYQEVLDPGFRRGDGFNDFLRSRQIITS
jgi:hypothetical protein